MIQVDETKIGKLLNGLNDEKENVSASVYFGNGGLQLSVSMENIESKTLEKIDSKEWTLTAIRPTYERRRTELVYKMPYDSLSVTNFLKEAIKDTYKKSKKGIRGMGIPIAKCPTCQKPGRLKIHDGYVSVYHKAKIKGDPADVHAMTRYIQSLNYDPEVIAGKLEKVIRGEIKIDNMVPTSSNLIIVEGSGRERVTSEDLGYYLKQLRESN